MTNNIAPTSLNVEECLHCAYLSLYAYANPSELYTMNQPTFICDPQEDAQAYLWRIDDVLYVVFRGTSSTKDVISDLDAAQQEYDKASEHVKVHRGFLKQFQSVKRSIEFYIKGVLHELSAIVFTGHSLGGALATLAACYFSKTIPSQTVQYKCITFGSPRVGNKNFLELYNSCNMQSVRIFNREDIVSMFPASRCYVHVSDGYCLNTSSKYEYCKTDSSWYSRLLCTLKFIFFRTIRSHSIDEYISRLKENNSSGLRDIFTSLQAV